MIMLIPEITVANFINEIGNEAELELVELGVLVVVLVVVVGKGLLDMVVELIIVVVDDELVKIFGLELVVGAVLDMVLVTSVDDVLVVVVIDDVDVV